MKSIILTSQAFKKPILISGNIPRSIIVFLLLICFSLGNLQAAIYNTRGSGNWNTPSTWSVDGVIATTIPGLTDEVIINPTHYISIPANFQAQCAKLTIGEFTGDDCKVSLNTGSFLKVNGLLTVFASKNSSFNELAINDGTAEVNTVEMYAKSNSRTAKLSVGTGLLKISGNFKMDLANGNSSKYSFLQISNDPSENGNGTQIGRAEIGGQIILLQQNVPDPQKIVFDLDPTSTIVFNSPSIQQLIPPLVRFGKVTIDQPVTNLLGVKPKADLTGTGLAGCIIRGELEVKSGKLVMDKVLNLTGMTVNNSDGTILITAGGSIINGSANNYIRQTGAGSLIIEEIGPGGRTGNIEFPVGTTASYTPATINNSTIPTNTKNTFAVKVIQGVQLAGAGLEGNAVNRTWSVECLNQTGNVNANLILQWNNPDQMAPFNHLLCSISQLQGAYWDKFLNGVNGDRPATRVAGPPGMDSPNSVLSISRSGITTFSQFAVSDNLSPLPVELRYFRATKQDAHVALHWETASEKNNAGFEIQASTDGREYQKVGYVASKNSNANFSQRYEFLDKTTRAGLVYYRLKQTDLDGTATYYVAKVVDMGRFLEAITAYPNPFNGQLDLRIMAVDAQPVELTVTDLTGKTIYHSNQEVTKGANTINLLLNEHPAGIYLLNARTGAQSFTTRLVKQ